MASLATRSARIGAGWLAAALLFLNPGTILGAGAVLDAGGFETYNPGPLNGQQGWAYSGLSQSGAPLNPSGATVQSSVVFSGSRAVKVDRVADVESWWAVPRSPLAPTLPSNRFLLVDWEMLVLSTGFADGRVGPYFGVEAYDAIGVFGRVGSLGVDATTSDVMYLKNDPQGAILTVVPNTLVDLGAWNHFGMLFDFTAGQYSIFVNGQRLLATAFSDPGVNQFTDADIAAYAAAEDLNSRQITGTAYVDNFRVLDGLPGDFQVDADVDAGDLRILANGLQQHGRGRRRR